MRGPRRTVHTSMYGAPRTRVVFSPSEHCRHACADLLSEALCLCPLVVWIVGSVAVVCVEEFLLKKKKRKGGRRLTYRYQRWTCRQARSKRVKRNKSTEGGKLLKIEHATGKLFKIEHASCRNCTGRDPGER